MLVVAFGLGTPRRKAQRRRTNPLSSRSLLEERVLLSPLLTGDENNTLKFADVENIYNSAGHYVSGNNAPAVGDYLVSIFNVTENTTNDWASIPIATYGLRDTYTGLSVAKITNISVAGGSIKHSLAAPSTGDVTTFTGGAYGDSTSFDVTAAGLNYANHDNIVIYHQGDTPADATLPVLGFNGTVANGVAQATEGTKYLSLDNQATNSYMFSTGTPPPASAFELTNFEGLQPDYNGTGFPFFLQIGDPNVNGGTQTVPFYIESKINYNYNGQFTTPPGLQHWDFQSDDPAVIRPATYVPASISGTVYVDVNQNNQFDSGTDTVIPNAPVTLTGTDEFGNPVSLSTTTDANGNYSFTNLVPSDSNGYTVTENDGVGYGDAATTVGTAGGTGTTDIVSSIVLNSGVNATNYNFGEVTGSIAGTVYVDSNDNGQLNTGEAGISGVPGTLTGTEINGNPVSLSTVKNANGQYDFTGLIASNGSGYTVTEGLTGNTYIEGLPNALGSLGSSNGTSTTDVFGS